MMNIHKLKQEICEIGSRIYKKGYASANDGNISFRLSENEVLCTPTQICKGFMKPDDLCIVDMDGNQLAGTRKRTSEIFLHLTIMKHRPEIKSVCHCHPPHATAFGIARQPIPQCVLPEVEIYFSDVPIAKYVIPGGQEFADSVLPYVDKTNIIVLGNHGVVSYDTTIERAYWWTELLDGYCRMLFLAKQLGNISYFNEQEVEDLMELKKKFGMQDPRAEIENCELCANDVFRDSWKETDVQHKAFVPPYYKSQPQGNDSAKNDQEALIQEITNRVMAALKG